MVWNTNNAILRGEYGGIKEVTEILNGTGITTFVGEEGCASGPEEV